MLIPWSSLQMENNACEPDRLFAIWLEFSVVQDTILKIVSLS